jgi:hypothetical protein
MNLYEYAVLYVPEDDDGKTLRSECRVLVEPTTMLASDEKTVAGMAWRAVPEVIETVPGRTMQGVGDYPAEDVKVDFDFVRVVVRPF